jgi:hypothetical protein
VFDGCTIMAVEPLAAALLWARYQTDPDWAHHQDIDRMFGSHNSYEYMDHAPMKPSFSQLPSFSEVTRLCVPTPVAACLGIRPDTAGRTARHRLKRLSNEWGWTYDDYYREVTCPTVPVCLSDPCINSTNPCCNMEGTACNPDNSRNAAHPEVCICMLHPWM